LAKHQKRTSIKIGIQDPAMESLKAYPFPGNIRELENIIQRAISFAKGPIITKQELESYLKSATQESLGNFGEQPLVIALDHQTYPTLKNHLQKIERDYVLAKLFLCEGSVSDAAKLMEITRTALHNKMKKLGIKSKEMKANAGLA
jgi:DNA-binding NtrC family response regulator